MREQQVTTNLCQFCGQPVRKVYFSPSMREDWGAPAAMWVHEGYKPKPTCRGRSTTAMPTVWEVAE